MTRIFSLFILISMLGMGCGPYQEGPPVVGGSDGGRPVNPTCDLLSIKTYNGFVYGDETYDGRLSRLARTGAVSCDKISGPYRNAAILGQYTASTGMQYWWIRVIPKENLTGTTEDWLYRTCAATVQVYQPQQPTKIYGPAPEEWVGQGGTQTLCTPL